MTKETGRVHYSDDIPGDRSNYKMAAKYDLTDGYLGISQTNTDGKIDRVLLSPLQVTELLQFCATHRPGRKQR